MNCPGCQAELHPNAKFCPECGTGIIGSLDRISRGSVLVDRYAILQPLARGGMSAVYLAEDRRLGNTQVVVKEMAWGARPNEQDQYLEAVEQFNREAMLLARLQHPNLPRVIDQFEQTGKHYLVMDYIAGKTLREIMHAAPQRQIELDQALQWGMALTNVLGYLHRQNPPIIYRDLKPANVMLHPDGRIVLIDFGIARFYKPGQSGDTAYFGTLGYAPAEQYGQDQTDARSDIYALGVMLHEMLTGYNPASTPFRRPPLRELRPDAPAALETALIRASAEHPAQRWQHMAEFEAALKDVQLRQANPQAVTELFIGPPPGFTPPISAVSAVPAADAGVSQAATPPRGRFLPWYILLGLLAAASGILWGVLGDTQPTVTPTAISVASSAPASVTPHISPTPEAVPPTQPALLQRLVPINVEASSTADLAVDAAGNQVIYPPIFAIDGDPSTAWRSRSLDSSASVEAESLTVHFAQPVTIERIGLIGGYAKIDPSDGTDRFAQNYVIRKIRLEFADGPAYAYDLLYSRDLQIIAVEPPVTSVGFRIVVIAADPPRSADPRPHLAISEVEVYGR